MESAFSGYYAWATFNIASYALLLHLLAKETGFKEGKLVGFLADVHILKIIQMVPKNNCREMQPNIHYQK